jgi:hypothetical protein
MYSELKDGRFVKTYLKGNNLKTDFIKTIEYTSALAFINLKDTHTKPPNPMT